MAGEEQTILRAQIELSDTKAHLFAFPDLQSTICSLNLLFGGIAQLVERQLCKLEVRGSNPLASNSMKLEATSNRKGTLSDALAGA